MINTDYLYQKSHFLFNINKNIFLTDLFDLFFFLIFKNCFVLDLLY